MEFWDLQAFVTVASERSFKRAGLKLGRTQPAISLAVRRLEEDVGGQLFHRKPSRSPELTEAGHTLLDYATRVLALREEAQRALDGLKDVRTGTLAIGADESFSALLWPVIECYRARHPDVRLEVRHVSPSHLAASLMAGEIALGVSDVPVCDSRFSSVVLSSEDVVLIAPPAHPLAGRRVAHCADLADQPFLAHDRAFPTVGWLTQLFDRLDTPFTLAMTLPSLHALRLAVQRGWGLTFLPRSCAADAIDAGLIGAIRLRERAPTRQSWLVRCNERQLAHAAQAFWNAPSGAVEAR
ncbi:MAG: LysR family transcriptional regulator [Luteitalea sp.]|nr:LysR family transcriptional regulator [Luteitalea sp.]